MTIPTGSGAATAYMGPSRLSFLNECHLRHIVGRYLDYYHDWRTPLSLSMDAPNPWLVHPPDRGKVVAFPELGDLHNHYERLAA